MKKPFIWLALAMVILLGTSGCTVVKISGRGAMPLVLNGLPAKTKVIRHFKEDKMIVFDYSNTFDVSEAVADKLAESEADALVSTTITVKYGVLDFLVDVITIGLAQAKDLQIEGDLVKIEAGSALDAPANQPNGRETAYFWIHE